MSHPVQIKLDGGRPRRSSESPSLLSSLNVAKLVSRAFRMPDKNSVGPKMLGLKQKPGMNMKNSLSMNDLSEARKVWEGERNMRRNEKDTMFGSKALFTFVQPTERQKITYREQQARLRRALARQKDFQREGCILDTLEKGVAYPVMHVSWIHDKVKDVERSMFPPISSDVRTGARRKVNNNQFKKIPELESSQETSEEGEDTEQGNVSPSFPVRLMKYNALGPSIYVQQGIYEEVKRIEPDYQFSDRDNMENRAFIVLGFKTLDHSFSSVLENTWRDWTGARAIYLKLHNEFDLSKIVFYHRINPTNDLDLFMYIVMVECWNVTNQNLIHILDFVQRMRVERLNGYISLYRDLGVDEGDSNYHSGSQESLDRLTNSTRSSVSPFSARSTGDQESDQGICMESQRRPGMQVTEKASSTSVKTRVVETLTIQRQPSIKVLGID